MQHDTIMLPRQATAAGWPQPTVTEHLAGTLAQVTPDERLPAVPHGAAETTLPDPAEAPDLDRLGNQIAELSARIQVATYELLCYLREFDRHHGWEGFRSCAHWLNWRTGLDLGAAREKLRVAAALADLNHISAAMACGRLSYSTVRALTRVATPATEARLVAVACCATAAQVERLVRAWRQADRAALPDAEQVRLASRALSTRVDDDGMVVLRARLTPEVGAVLLRALEAALEQVPAAAQEEEAPTIAQRRADALGLVAESALAGALDAGSPGDRYQVAVHVAAETLAASPEPAPAALGAISAETREISPAASAALGASWVALGGYPPRAPTGTCRTPASGPWRTDSLRAGQSAHDSRCCKRVPGPGAVETHPSPGVRHGNVDPAISATGVPPDGGSNSATARCRSRRSRRSGPAACDSAPSAGQPPASVGSGGTIGRLASALC